MSDSQQEDIIPSAQPIAPPTHPGAIAAPPQRSTWPRIIGILAIVLGAGGFLMGIWGFIYTTLIDELMYSAPEESAMIPVIQKWAKWNVASYLLAGAAGLLLLVAGISIVKKRASARKLITAWALIKIAAVVFTMILTHLQQQHTLAAMQQDPNMPAMGGGFYATLGLLTLAIGMLWGWAFPVFALVWFRRNKIKNEVAGWG